VGGAGAPGSLLLVEMVADLLDELQE